MPNEREGQLYCGECSKPIGLSGQPAAYGSLLERKWLCPYHNDAEQRRMNQVEGETDETKNPRV